MKKIQEFFTNNKMAVSYIVLAIIVLGAGLIVVDTYPDSTESLQANYDIDKRLLELEIVQADNEKTILDNPEDEKVLADANEVLANANKDARELKEKRLKNEYDINKAKEEAIKSNYVLAPIALFIALLGLAIPYAMAKDSENPQKQKQNLAKRIKKIENQLKKRKMKLDKVMEAITKLNEELKLLENNEPPTNELVQSQETIVEPSSHEHLQSQEKVVKPSSDDSSQS